MSLPNTESLTAGFPLVIPTGSQQPAARLVLRNDRGQAVQQWLIKQNKCTLGSASGCSLKCELQGIAPYHALLVIGSRQIFIRALAPKLTRNGRPFNEILLTDEESHFEIAGHRFELSRSGSSPGSAAKAANSKTERLKFTLARPFELSQRRAPTTTIVSATSSPTDSLPSSTANLDGKWVAKLIRSAVEPLETQLHNLVEPLAELTAESRKFRRLQNKWLMDKQAPAEPTVAAIPSTPIVDPKISRQVEDLVLKHSSSMEMLTERISDVNQQLSTIERIIAEERAENLTTPIVAEDPRLAQQSLAVEQLQAGMGIVSETLQHLQTQHSQEHGLDQQWRTEIHEKLLGLSEVVASLTATVTEVHRNVLGQQEQLRLVPQVDHDAPWKANIQDQLANLSDAMQQLSGTLTDVRQEVVRQQERQLPQDTSAMDQQWKTQIQDHLVNLGQVFDTLTGTVAEVQQTTLKQLALQQSTESQNARDPWRATVEGQFASLTQVIAGLSSNLNDIQLKTLGEIEQQKTILRQLHDSPWQNNIEHKIQELTQVVDGLAASITAVHSAVSEEKPEPQTAPESEAMSQWKLEVRQQLSTLTDIVTGLATTVNEVHQIAISESTDQVEYTQTCHLPGTAEAWPANEESLQVVRVAPAVEPEPFADEVQFAPDSPHDEFSNWNLQPEVQDQDQDQDQDQTDSR
jgi:hypothetical protein